MRRQNCFTVPGENKKGRENTLMDKRQIIKNEKVSFFK